MVIAASVVSVLAILLGSILLVRFHTRQVAAFHRKVTNRIAIRFAHYLPGFAVLTNFGRKSGRLYRTPVNVFREPDGFLIALTYGRESGWVKNVLAAEGCEIETRGVTYQLSEPIVVHDASRRRFPLVVRVVLGLIGANDFLQFRMASSTSAGVALRTSRYSDFK